MALWGRRTVLQIGAANRRGREFTGEDFRIGFRVTMSASSTPNKGELRLYNASPDTIALAQAPGAVVRCLVGYGTDVPRLIFQGDPISDGVRTERQSTDRLLIIEAQDGGRAYQESRMSETLATDTTLAEFAQRAADSMGIPLGALDLGDTGQTTLGALSLSGSTRDILDRVARMGGARWTIRDGALQLFPSAGSTGEQAIVFSARSGNLIGAPVRKDGGKVEVQALIAPSMRPGRPFKLESETVSGFYVAEDVRFEGDSGWTEAFYVKVTGRPL